MQKIRWTLVSQLYCEILLPSIIIYWYWKVSWNPEHSWYWQSYLPVFFEALHNNTTTERKIQSKKRAEMAHEICLDSTKTAGFFNTHVHGEFPALDRPLCNFHQWQLTWEAPAQKEFTCHCHLSLKSAKLKCVSNVTIYNLPSAGMISHIWDQPTEPQS